MKMTVRTVVACKVEMSFLCQSIHELKQAAYLPLSSYIQSREGTLAKENNYKETLKSTVYLNCRKVTMALLSYSIANGIPVTLTRVKC